MESVSWTMAHLWLLVVFAFPLVASVGCDRAPEAGPDASPDAPMSTFPCMPPCDDGIDCTDDTCLLISWTDPPQGRCVHEPRHAPCDDGNECTVNTCSASSGCETSNVPDDTPCGSRGDAVCRQGICIVPCTEDADCPEDLCTAGPPTCDPLLGCQWGATLVHCEGEDDGVACTEYACDPATGECAHLLRHSRCDDGNDCTIGTCDPALGCQTSSYLECPTPCAGGSGICMAGTCIPIPCSADSECDDGIACTIDTCVDPCTYPPCSHEPDHSQCDDGDPCTTGTCDPAVGCRFDPIPDCTP
jgi:hypothetical protein